MAFGQGVPFFTAGSEFLRSKSGDNNSYNSGDWFNRLDYSLKSNNWGVGLPPDERQDWSFWAPRLADPLLRPSPAELRGSVDAFEAMLRIRAGSPLFRLSSTDDVQARLSFLETDFGPNQTPGLLVMALHDDIASRPILDRKRSLVIVAFNVTRGRSGSATTDSRAASCDEWNTYYQDMP